MAPSLQDEELMTVESSPVPAGKRKRQSSTSTPHLIFVSILFIIAVILRSPAMESLATSSPTSYVPNRRLKHNNHSNTNETEIDYTIYSCDALRDLRTKYENTNRFNQCEFAHECNEGDGIIFPSLFCNYTTIQHSHIPLLLFLCGTLLLLFRLLSSTTDEFFSPGLELFSLKLGLPPRFAGVTLLALGNGAPDVAATMNAILGDERKGYEMALGELTGVCMFVTTVILGVIVSISGSGTVPDVGDKNRRKSAAKFAGEVGVPCQGPLLRDVAVLIFVCVVSMSYLKRGIVDYSFVYTLLGIYGAYVLLVLGADAYHIFYHLPLVKATSGTSLNDLLFEEEEEGVKDEEKKTGVNEQTSLISKEIQLRRRRSHSPILPIHTHSIGDTIIESMSNYSCRHTANQESKSLGIDTTGNSHDLQDTEVSPNNISPSNGIFKARPSSGWAPIEEDGTEPLVIFHPHHAVHPHHKSNGPLFVRSRSTDSATNKANRRQFSWNQDDSEMDGDEKIRHSSFNLDTVPLSIQQDGGAVSIEKGMHLTPGSAMTDNDSVEQQIEVTHKKPADWNEALSENIEEFKDHWHDFYTDIYRNEENSLLDVVFLSVELPFTILRKLTNPVPCDGYKCTPLVAISLPLSSFWIWFYISEQYGIDIFRQSYIGCVILAITLTMGLVVIRYSPGGDGPMDLYMVIPLTLYGFAIAATWLDSIADKLVELLDLFGLLLGIPSTVLGLTVLAFGNSIQDLVANVTLSKKGLSTMATTACFAGPIFNLCIGLGVGFWALMKATGKDEIHVALPRNIATGFCFTIANCGLIVFAGVVIGKGTIGRSYGYVACSLYAVYVITSIYI